MPLFYDQSSRGSVSLVVCVRKDVHEYSIVWLMRKMFYFIIILALNQKPKSALLMVLWSKAGLCCLVGACDCVCV